MTLGNQDELDRPISVSSTEEPIPESFQIFVPSNECAENKIENRKSDQTKKSPQTEKNPKSEISSKTDKNPKSENLSGLSMESNSSENEKSKNSGTGKSSSTPYRLFLDQNRRASFENNEVELTPIRVRVDKILK